MVTGGIAGSIEAFVNNLLVMNLMKTWCLNDTPNSILPSSRVSFISVALGIDHRITKFLIH